MLNLFAYMYILGLLCTQGYQLDTYPTNRQRGMSTSSEVSQPLNNPKLQVMIFWSHKCSPCLREMPRIDSIAEAVKDRAQFKYVNSEDYDPKIYQEKYVNLSFLWDKDSVIWKKYNPTAWGIVVIEDGNNMEMWKGYTYQITDRLLETLMAGDEVEVMSPKYVVNMSVEQSVEPGPSEIAYDPDAEGLHMAIKNKTIGAVFRHILRSIHGFNANITSIDELNANIPHNITLKVDCSRAEAKRLVLNRLLRMLAGGYNVDIVLKNPDQEHVPRNIVIDYSEYLEY